MATVRRQCPQPAAEKLDDDSAVTILRHLEEERGKMFTEAEYLEIRGAILDELAHGARIRPFTLFTFAVVGAGLLAMLALGLAIGSGRALSDYALALISAAALMTVGHFFWSFLRGIKLDAIRSLDSRLAELEQLRELRLVSTEEYQRLQAHILIARQHGA